MLCMGVACYGLWSPDLTFFGSTPVTALDFHKVARYSFSGPIPPRFEHKLSRHKQSFEKLPPQLY